MPPKVCHKVSTFWYGALWKLWKFCACIVGMCTRTTCELQDEINMNPQARVHVCMKMHQEKRVVNAFALKLSHILALDSS